MKIREKQALVILLIWPIIASITSFILKVNAFTSVVLYFILPSLFLSALAKKYVKKALIFSASLGIPLIIIIDYIAHLNNTWIIPNSILGFRLLGFVTFEVILWSLFNLYFVVMFYEYFLDKHYTKHSVGKNMKYLVLIVIVLLSFFAIALIALPELLHIPYFYLVFGIITMVIPLTLQMTKFPKVLPKIIKVGAYFFYLSFLYEITALKLGLWDFPSIEFLGWITFLGVSFPLEEFFFWLMLFAMAILSAYEYYDDDEK